MFDGGADAEYGRPRWRLLTERSAVFNLLLKNATNGLSVKEEINFFVCSVRHGTDLNRGKR